MRGNREGRGRFFEVKANGEMSVKNEGHGHHVAGRGCRRIAVDALKNMG
jgi:hypothetical protein